MSNDATRRAFLHTTGMGLASIALGCTSGTGKSGADDTAEGETGTEDAEDTASELCVETTDNIEGPFYREGAPARGDLDLFGDIGTSLSLSGIVTGTDCVPIPAAVIEVWQADPQAAYDNDSEEMRYRGHVLTDADGRYSFHTLVPGRYLNGAEYRPAHIHVKVWVGGVERLTTQIYFEGDPYLKSDPFVDEGLVVPLVDDGAGGLVGEFPMAIA
jgi:protocatechuate 3,4-dioxygenase beta subunit